MGVWQASRGKSTHGVPETIEYRAAKENSTSAIISTLVPVDASPDHPADSQFDRTFYAGTYGTSRYFGLQ
jgi:hypothetical protein